MSMIAPLKSVPGRADKTTIISIRRVRHATRTMATTSSVEGLRVAPLAGGSPHWTMSATGSSAKLRRLAFF